MRERVRSVAAAVTFLTAVPVGRTQLDERSLRGGAALFPVVGAVVGGLVALVAWGASLALPPFVAALLGVIAGVIVTAGLHVDGLADVADGLGAGLTGRDASAAMRDPRLGTFGGAALLLDLVLKASVLGALVARHGFPLEAVAAGALARVAPLALSAALPYVRRAGGIGAWTSGLAPSVLVAAIVIASSVGIATVGPRFIAMVAAGVVATALLGRWAAVRLGGVTGDVLGAAAELVETFALTTALATR